MRTVCGWARPGLLVILLVLTMPLAASPAGGKIPTTQGAEVAARGVEPLRVGLNGNACAFSTITEAVAVAQSGDEVFIEVGSYNERIGAILNKDLTLRAAESDSNCTLAEGVFSFKRAVVDGTGVAEFSGIGGILDLTNSSVSLIAVDLTNGVTGQGGLVYVGPGSSFSTNGSALSNGTASSDRINPGLPSDTDEPAGGCIYAEGANVSFTITTFTNCRVIGPKNGQDPVDGDGGAIHARGGSMVSGGIVTGLVDNSARSGGAIALFDSSADISEIDFTNNTASVDGGAIAGRRSAIRLGFNSTFRDNSASGSGGAINVTEQSLEITDAAIFSTNSAGGGGGAIRVAFGDLRIRPSSDEFFPAFFRSNSAGVAGGAIYLEQGLDLLPNPTIQGIDFVNNSTPGLGGGLALVGVSDIEVVDASFAGNTSGFAGGAVYSQTSTSVFRSSETCKAFQFADPNEYCSQFVGNMADNGSAIYYGDDSTGNQVLTTAFAGNTGTSAVRLVNAGNEVSMESVWFYNNLGDAVVASADSVYRVVHGTFDNNAGSAYVGADASSLTMLNSIAFGNGGGVTSVGTGPVDASCNIDQSGMAGPNIDPLFVNTGDGDSHLAQESPAVNACLQEAALTVDLEGRARSEGPAPDMGAFEFTDLVFEDGFESAAGR